MLRFFSFMAAPFLTQRAKKSRKGNKKEQKVALAAIDDILIGGALTWVESAAPSKLRNRFLISPLLDVDFHSKISHPHLSRKCSTLTSSKRDRKWEGRDTRCYPPKNNWIVTSCVYFWVLTMADLVKDVLRKQMLHSAIFERAKNIYLFIPVISSARLILFHFKFLHWYL